MVDWTRTQQRARMRQLLLPTAPDQQVGRATLRTVARAAPRLARRPLCATTANRLAHTASCRLALCDFRHWSQLDLYNALLVGGRAFAL